MFAAHWRGILIGVGAVVAVVIGYVIVGSWLGSHDAIIKAQAESAAQAQLQKQYSEQQKQLTDEIGTIAESVHAMQTEQAARMKSLEDKFARSSSPADVATIAAELMKLQQPVTFVTPPATAANPNPVPVAQISTADTPAVKAYLQSCEECKLNLETRTRELTYAAQRESNLNDQIRLRDLTIESQGKEIVTWQTAAKGGTKWQRFKSAMKYVGIGVVIGVPAGVAAACAAGKC